MKRILVIENDPLVRDLVETVAARCGHAVQTAFGADSLVQLDRHRFDLVIAGLETHGECDLTIVETIRRRTGAPILGLSTELPVRPAAGTAGLAGLLPIPFTVEEMAAAVEAALTGLDVETA